MAGYPEISKKQVVISGCCHGKVWQFLGVAMAMVNYHGADGHVLGRGVFSASSLFQSAFNLVLCQVSPHTSTGYEEIKKFS